jgi:Glyoxalase-like domain
LAPVAIRLGSTVINCADLELMTTFWSRALGLTPGPASEAGAFRVLGGKHVNISLQVAKTPITARDQMHLDLYTAEKQAEVQRLLALGATWVRTSGDPDDDYDVLMDPEGNEFCVCLVPE